MAGEVSKQKGSHLCEYPACPNKHLRKTFKHPVVEKYGVTRLEVSILGFSPTKNYTGVLENEYRLFAGKEIFHIQPGTKQWENLAESVTKSLVLGDRTHGEIFHAWFGNSETRKLAGVVVKTTEKVRTDEKEWKNAMQWVVSSFGFHHLPIFSTSFSIVENEEGGKSISLEPLECWMKDGPTYLAPSTKPGKVFPKDMEPPNKMLPDTPYIRWIWQTKKQSQRIGLKPIEYPIYSIGTERKVSTWSRRKREEKILELREQQNIEVWKEKIRRIAKENEDEKYRKIGIQKQELAEILAGKEKVQKERERRENIIPDFSKSADMQLFRSKLARGEKLYIYAYRKYPDSKARVAYFDSNGEKGIFFDNKGFERYVEENCASSFHRIPDREIVQRKNCPIYYTYVGCEIEYSLFEKFQENEQKKIYTEIPKCLVCVDFVEYYKIQDVAKEGEYLVYQYSERIYRKNKQTILFLETEDGQIPVCGYFLQQEINAIEDFENIQVPLVVLVGKSKTTPQKHKDRMVSLGWVKSDIPISCSIDTTEIKNNLKK